MEDHLFSYIPKISIEASQVTNARGAFCCYKSPNSDPRLEHITQYILRLSGIPYFIYLNQSWNGSFRKVPGKEQRMLNSYMLSVAILSGAADIERDYVVIHTVHGDEKIPYSEINNDEYLSRIRLF